jgi:hypothetical protein
LPGNTNCGERFSTVGLLIKVAGFVKRGKQYFEYKKGDDLHWLVDGGHLD